VEAPDDPSLDVHENPDTAQNPSRLIIEEGEYQGMIFPLRDAVVSVGRGPDNTIQIIDSRMSRRHALLLFSSGGWFVRDLGSKNGVQINNQPVRTDRPLSSGDRLLIGDTCLTFEQETRSNPVTDFSTGMRVEKDDLDIKLSDVVKLRSETDSSDVNPIFGVAPGDDQGLQILCKVAEMTISVLDQDELLEKLIDLVQKYLEPHRCGILLHDEKYDILLPKAIRRPVDSTEDIIISNAIIDKSITEQGAVLVSDAPHDRRFMASDSIVIQRIHSAICAPLIYKGEVLGVLYLDRQRPADNYGQRDLTLVAGIANQAALTIANARLHRRLLAKYGQERELEIARSIQEKLLPREMPRLPGHEVSGMSRPARMVGGDYFDVITLRDGRTLMVVGDVSGKGVPAAILLSSVRAAVQVEASRIGEEKLSALVERLNQMTYRDTSSNMFVTMFLALLEPTSGRLTYCNAGHTHPILCGPDGELRTLETGGCLLGVMPGAVYEEADLELPQGSQLVMFSDGVTDTLNVEGEALGFEALSKLVIENRERSAGALCAMIDDMAQEYRGEAEPFDDFTVLILKTTRK
jgi:serine phosphatase RsbU (regulator of sigma subunit)/pSer/pThr/pTyr-binding forkhead associated (FHA) protein